ncbi:MAG: tRNA uridine-5-carboxymethylaminomethyl(34) synthesis GTPase MnmE [Oscillospiraceae bacterium]|nr:tRNA uridine-5-carboxymethylaminomethyl(34) synthesis GTPase MnmE [Oscillospiraceae bacterium]MBQ8923133.1 tRNA uridine-5-carboxymethylaminomethyl(34) synthesis GTPase MnmE [Oscillospiraceae bacterium]
MSTIAAISTPQAVGGIAMIRMSGEDALAIAEQVFVAANHTKVTEMRGYTCAYGYIRNADERIDDVVLTVFRAPHSYTGEDTVEITCHGGIYLTNEILHLLLMKGAVPAEPGEFTKRSFLNGKLSLSQAEAVMDVIEADGRAALHQANLVKDGRLSRQMREVTDQIVGILSALAYWMDDAEEFPPELEASGLSAQIRGIYEKLSEMAEHYQDGKILKNGIRTVLLGRPNAGKSSVMNWLCGENRSIVTDIPGTTRDVITESVKIGPYLLVLSDTAGIRETENKIESIGIEQAMRTLDTADLVLYVVDSVSGLTPEDEQVLTACRGHHVLILWNKIDLCGNDPGEIDFPVVQCAAISEDSLAKMEDALREVFPVVSGNQPSVINERQFRLLSQANFRIREAISLLESGGELDMVAGELEQAARFLSEIDGKDISRETIDGVFSRFCVGK